ncbi:MAG: DoxX family membrane protein [Candidatus Zixiibacteriota bacterium]|nr:MAG: DoxX family membrane protein [candidate division Zixibacteria bacterium]
MRRVIDNDILTLMVRMAIGITFIYASYYKIIGPGDFAKSIWYYHLVPGALINLIAVFLPWMELLCGLCLIFGVGYRGSLWLVTIMTVVFVVAIASAIARGIDLDCGCFKAAKSSSASTWKPLLFDVGLLVLLAQLYLSRSRKWFLAGR